MRSATLAIALSVAIVPALASEPVVLFEETFGGPANENLSGRAPSVHLAQPTAVWLADPIVAANGQVNDGNNTDRGAVIDLGPDFGFLPDSTYTLTLGWSNLENAILFAGFATAPPNVNAQTQTQGINIALRARRIASGDRLGAWQNPGGNFTTGGTDTPATGTATLVLTTNALSNATFAVDGASRSVDLSAGYRFLWIGYEDPTSGTSDARFTGLTLAGPPLPEPPPAPPTVTIQPESSVIAPGQLISLTGSIEDSPVFFTLDGSLPDSGSTLYSGPFALNASATVRAVAIGQNGQPGLVATRSYTVASPIGTPNLLVIVGDAVGFGDLHCNGGVAIATPALDSLAHDGIRFTQFTTTGPGAAASQFALLSGRVAARSGMGGNAPVAGASGWNAEEWTLAEMLRRRGYQTAFIGEWLLGNSKGSHPNDQGFQIFHGLPFSQTLNPPLEENREILSAVPNPGVLLETLTQRAVDFLTTAPTPFALVFHPPALPAAGNSLAGPHGNRIEALDLAVSQLLAALDSHDLADDTLVLFLGNGGAARTADGGSNGILRDGAGTTWEGGLRSPLIARLPGTLPASQMNLSLVWLPDLMPTLTALVGGGLAADRPLDGTPQPESLTGLRTRPTGDEAAYAFRHEGNAWQLATVRQGRWKSHLSIVNIDPLNDNPTTGSQLHDLHVDAEERINRAGGQPAILAQLQSLATSFSATLPAAGTTDLPSPKPAVIDGISTSLESNASAVRFEFSRPADSLDENYRIEHSDDLVAWENLVITPYVMSLTPAAGLREDLEIRVPLGVPPIDGGRRFVRMHAERPANP